MLFHKIELIISFTQCLRDWRQCKRHMWLAYKIQNCRCGGVVEILEMCSETYGLVL
jgi:hypothetical protein